MRKRVSLVAAGNTANPSLLVLRSKGYALRAETEDDDRVLYLASKDGCELAAFSPAELLGLAVLWETCGEDWNQQSPDVLSELLDTSVEARVS